MFFGAGGALGFRHRGLGGRRALAAGAAEAAIGGGSTEAIGAAELVAAGALALVTALAEAPGVASPSICAKRPRRRNAAVPRPAVISKPSDTHSATRAPEARFATRRDAVIGRVPGCAGAAISEAGGFGRSSGITVSTRLAVPESHCLAIGFPETSSSSPRSTAHVASATPRSRSCPSAPRCSWRARGG